MSSASHSMPTFGDLRVAAFESRRAPEMERLITRMGGRPLVSPSLREVPLDADAVTKDFVVRLLAGEIQVVILLTGVGTRHLVAQVERHADRQQFLEALAGVAVVARGPKPVAALKELGIQPRWKAAEPNTWQEVLQTVEEHLDVSGLTVAVQEYGETNPDLTAGLEKLGARVLPLAVYRYDFPEDSAPLAANVQAWTDGAIDVALFTSAHQVVNLLRMAGELGLAAPLREQAARIVIGSIGPTTSEALREHGLPVDLEPEHARMGQLVAAAAERSRDLLTQKRGPRHAFRDDAARLAPLAVQTPSPRGVAADSLFLKACRREPCERTPIWLMRQAGRYMPEYRAVRAQGDFMALCKNPQLCAEVMLTAVERLGVDAAIIFADLLPMLEPMGIQLEYAPGEGPIIHNPVRSASDVDRVRELENLDALSFVPETVKLTRQGLPSTIPVLGFAGAPFTLASYIMEGGSSRSYLHAKGLMYRDAGAFHALLSRLARAVTLYLNGQIAAGAQAVQLFDSWAGCLSPADYRRHVQPHMQSIIRGITPGVPVINFATGNPALLPLVAEGGGDVIGLDWRVRLDDGWRIVGHDKAVQGNMDPVILLADISEIRRQAADVLAQAGGRPGHIFNLGHGVLPQTPVENVLALIEIVRELSSGGRGP